MALLKLKSINDSVMLTTFTNLLQSEFTGLELIFSANIKDKANLNLAQMLIIPNWMLQILAVQTIEKLYPYFFRGWL